jgi:hypothetical protein
MQKLTALLVAVLVATGALAQEAAPQQETKYFYTRQECKPVGNLLEEVIGRYGETALFTAQNMSFSYEGESYTGGAMFVVNQTTGTWTLMVMYADGTACVAGAGTEFKPFVK